MKTTTILLLATMSIQSIAATVTPEFLDRLAQIESGGDDSAVNVSEGAHGRYQIRQCYLDDANEVLRASYTLADMHDPAKAALVVEAYLRRYGSAYEARTGNEATAVDLARIHNGGPRGAEKSATLAYGETFAALAEGGEE